MIAHPASTDERLSPAEIVLLVTVVVLARLIATQWVHVYDDAFITFRYARNWASGAGMTYNPGAEWEPILGTTTPGYTAVMALLLRTGLAAVPASLLFNLAADGASALLLVRLAGGRRRLAGVLLLGFALMPELVRISVGGMEAPLLVTLTLAACLALRERKAAWAGIAAASACTVRPEAVLLVAWIAFELRRERALLRRFAVPVLVIGVLYAGALTAYFGDPIPNSVRSKAVRHSGSALLSTWREILRQAFLPRWQYLLFLPFLVMGLGRALRPSCSLRPLLGFGLAIILAYLAARPHTWGWYYAVPLVGWIVAVSAGLDRVLGARVGEERLERCFRIGLPVLAVAIVAFGIVGPARDPVTERVYQPLEAWAAAEGLADGAHTFLASDIGALGYYGHGVVLDSEGLTWPHADPSGAQVGKILEHRPDYLMLTAVVAKIAPFRASREARELYEPILRLSAQGETELEPELGELATHWTQDYILYRRRVPE